MLDEKTHLVRIVDEMFFDQVLQIRSLRKFLAKLTNAFGYFQRLKRRHGVNFLSGESVCEVHAKLAAKTIVKASAESNLLTIAGSWLQG